LTTSESPDWFEAIAAYDAIAPRYDEVPVENRINAYMRRVSVSRLLATFEPGSRVLELGCGTGDEAIELAKRGVRVVALDPSPLMIAQAREKAVVAKLEGRLSFLCSSSREISSVLGSGLHPFDGAYASFSLGYERNLAPVVAALDNYLEPGAPLLATIPSKICLVEFLIALASMRLRLPGQRLRTWHWHKVGQFQVPIRTYSHSQLRLLLAPAFDLQSVEALPAIIPPPYMNRIYKRLNGLIDGLEKFDEKIRGLPILRNAGDHLLVRARHRFDFM